MELEESVVEREKELTYRLRYSSPFQYSGVREAEARGQVIVVEGEEVHTFRMAVESTLRKALETLY